MARKMLRFAKVEQRLPDKREAGARRQDFDEIYDDFEPAGAAEQASRCSQCGVPFCQVHCPVNNNIPDWLMLTAEGRLEEAYEVSQATNNFPEICGRICPQDRLCEGNCVIETAGHGTVTIGAVERYITDTAFAKGWVKPIEPPVEQGLSVGIVGAGPAGLAAAEQLRKQGWQVTVYDRYDRIGGLLIYGIPNFKLEKEVVLRRAEMMRRSKIAFELECEVGRDLSLQELRRRHDAVLIATGVYKARDLMVPRQHVTMLDVSTPWAEVVRTVAASPFSRVPVYRGAPDNVIGILRVKDLTTHFVLTGGAALERLLRPACRIPADTPADRVLSLLKEHRTHQALVTDEQERIIGLVAIQDVPATFLDLGRERSETR